MVFDKTREFAYLAEYYANEIYKILSINFQEDSFELIKIDREELDEGHGYSETLSTWLSQAGEAGMVHPEDLIRYNYFLDVKYMQKYFLEGNKRLTVTYRKKIHDEYKWVTTRVYAASDYSEENQSAILIIQADDSIESLEIMSFSRMQIEILRSIASVYVTMHAIKLDDDTFIDLNNAVKSNLEFDVQPNATLAMKMIMLQRIDPSYIHEALEFTDVTTLKERLKGQKSISRDLLGTYVGWVRIRFMTAQYDENGDPSLILFTTENINEEKIKEDKLKTISTELDLAMHIQEAVLPSVFPPYPNQKEFDIYASMQPAKEVGGDFYDFFFIDDDHFGMVIADVSGKGIPAALYMMVSKAIIKNQANNIISPAEILKKVNEQLCEDNDMEMFVTVWLGVLEVSTGKIIACNAGHEYPVIRRKDEKFALYTDKHSLPLGCFPKVNYRDYEFQLNPGDQIYVYTDGVVEATNSQNELFGTNRMLEALNADLEESIESKLTTVSKHIQSFVQEAIQFDDITMMLLQYNGKNS